MKVAVVPSDLGGCGSYRLIWPAQAVKNLGHDVKIIPNPQLLVRSDNTVMGLAQNIDADIVVLQRPARDKYLKLIDYLQKKGYKVVVDMDDDLANISKSNTAYGAYNSAGATMHWQYAKLACKRADLVTCATEALAAEYGNGSNSVVLSNCIPEWYLGVKPEGEHPLVTVGWPGFLGTHPADLQITHGAVNQAIAETKGKARFIALGDQKALPALGVREREPNGWFPGVGLPEYPRLVSLLDIGIAPLEDTKFNKAKSWLKGLEYGSLGIAPVLSPTPDNMRMVEAGAALSAANPREWKEHLIRLINDEDERTCLQKSAKEFAATQTIEGNAWKWEAAWQSVL